jgi:hypothetical protein
MKISGLNLYIQTVKLAVGICAALKQKQEYNPLSPPPPYLEGTFREFRKLNTFIYNLLEQRIAIRWGPHQEFN